MEKIKRNLYKSLDKINEILYNILVRLIKKTSIEDAIKYEMAQQGAETLTAGDYKMTWKVVTGTRFDSTAFKKANPELAKAYTKETRTCRFTIN